MLELLSPFEWIVSIWIVATAWFIGSKIWRALGLKYTIPKLACACGVYYTVAFSIELFLEIPVAGFYGGVADGVDRRTVMSLIVASFLIILLPIIVELIMQWVQRRSSDKRQ